MTQDVSRETSEMLDAYADELLRWTKKINLISKADQTILRQRHITDSLQVEKIAPRVSSWLDLGSGGGLPAIPIAILRRDDDVSISLIESDSRKCAFLRHIARLLNLRISVLTQRIEEPPMQRAEVVSARALAELPKLLELSRPHATPSTIFLFPKGEEWSLEVDKARNSWHFDCEAVPSETRTGAAILCIKNVRAQ